MNDYNFRVNDTKFKLNILDEQRLARCFGFNLNNSVETHDSKKHLVSAAIHLRFASSASMYAELTMMVEALYIQLFTYVVLMLQVYKVLACTQCMMPQNN